MPGTILIADDNESVRTILKLSLQFKGYTLVEMVDGQLAWEELQREPAKYDLLLSDIAMPNMTGLELLARVRADERFKSLPVVICSAEEDATEAGMMELGASAFLVKPCAPMKLIETVGRLIG